MRTIALNLALYLANSFATDYGASYIAAQTILINIWLFSAFFIDGYGAAGNILGGRLLGAKKYNDLWILTKRVNLYNLFVSLLLVVVGILLYHQLGLIFTKDTLVLSTFYGMFFISRVYTLRGIPYKEILVKYKSTVLF